MKVEIGGDLEEEEERKSRTSKVFNKTETPFSTFCLWQASFLECSQSRYDTRQRQQVLRRTGRHSRYLSRSTLAEWISHPPLSARNLSALAGEAIYAGANTPHFSDYQGPSAEQLLTVPQCSIGCAGERQVVTLRKVARGGVDWRITANVGLGRLAAPRESRPGAFRRAMPRNLQQLRSALPHISLVNWGEN